MIAYVHWKPEICKHRKDLQIDNVTQTSMSDGNFNIVQGGENSPYEVKFHFNMREVLYIRIAL